MDFFDDGQFVVVGIIDLYICVWLLDGKVLLIMNVYEKDVKFNSWKLIGYFGFVYDVFFFDLVFGFLQKFFGEEGK